MRTVLATRPWTASDDEALEAILALERLWQARGGHVTLADLGLDGALRERTLWATCPTHGTFARRATFRSAEPAPTVLDCPIVGRDGERCALPSLVRDTEPLAPAA